MVVKIFLMFNKQRSQVNSSMYLQWCPNPMFAIKLFY